MSKKSEEIKLSLTDVFNKVSALYDSGRNKFFTDFGRDLVGNMNLQSNSKVLDIASGRGAVLFPAFEKLGSHGEILGIDLSEGMLEKVSLDIKKKNYKIKMYNMDAEKLDFEDNSFDFVFCGFALFFFPNLQNALSEILRVLKPNGRFGTSTFFEDPIYSDDNWYYDLYKKYKPVEKVLSESKDNDSESEIDKKPVFHTKEGMREILQKAGFADLKIFNEEKDYYYNKDEWWDERLSHAGRRAIDRLSSENLTLFKKDVYEKLDQLETDKGVHNKMSILFSYGHKSI